MFSQNKTKRKWLPLVMGPLLLGLIFFMTISKPSSSEPVSQEELTPTLFVHGYKGGPRSFQTMIDRMQALNWGKKRMVIYLSSDGHLSIQGNFPQTNRPFIQVLFENNRASIHDQTHWLQKIMTRLKSHHNVQQVNLIGHSMGGLASVNYLLSETEAPVPRVEKLAVIASPFEGIKKEGYFASNYGDATIDLEPGSEALKQMVQNKENFAPHIEVLAIAGVINKSSPEQEHWDGLVHASSVSGLEKIVPFGQYHEERLYHPLATHSGLHELSEVDLLVGQFLWEQE